MPRIKVLVADDVASVREAVRAILEMDRGLEVVGEAADGEEAFRKVLAIRPDIVLMDVSMPKMDGLEATQKIRDALPDIGVILVTFHDIKATQLDECGADGYLQKGASPDEIFTAIRRTRLSVLLDTTLADLALPWKKALAWLVTQNLVTIEQVEEIADFYRDNGHIDVPQIAKDYVAEEDIAAAISFGTELPSVGLAPYPITNAGDSFNGQKEINPRKVDPVHPSAAKRIPAALASDLCLVPLAVVGDEIIVAMANPIDYKARAMVEEAAGMKVRPVVGTVSEIQNAIQRVFYRLATSSILSCLLSKETEV